MLSRQFPVSHPRAGEGTSFNTKILNTVFHNNASWQKIHTIRANWKLWCDRIYEVRQGKAILSLRQWRDKPYRSKTFEITRLTAADGVGVQMLRFYKDRDGMVSWNRFDIDGKYLDIETLAHNDGLTLEDWKAWFKDYDFSKPLAVIHFTPFRY